MILEPGPEAPPHFFLIGYRAPPGQQGTAFEQVGVVVTREVVHFDGLPVDQGEVRKEDEPFDGLPAEGPFRFESEIAAWKPETDLIVVDDLDTFLTPAQIADPNLPTIITSIPFGSVEIDRGSGYGAAIPLNFGWLTRTEAPRLDLAGRRTPPNDPSSLQAFDPELFRLPDQFDNGFMNGGPVAGVAALEAGDRLRFTDTESPVVTVSETIVPAAPVLTVSEDGAPLDPPLALDPRVDTVVLDRGAREFTFVWRATFPWEARFETATLGVN
jgi:hypothetical protein